MLGNASWRLLPHQSRYAILHSACHCRDSIPSGPSATQFLFAVTRQARTYIWRIVMQSQLKSANCGKQKVTLYAKGNLFFRAIELILISCWFHNSYWNRSVLTVVRKEVLIWETGWGSWETTIFAISLPRQRYGGRKREGFFRLRKEDFEWQSRA